MKVILLQDVPKIGKRRDVKQVSDGYAMNYLLPRKLAELATDSKVKMIEKRSAAESEREVLQQELLEKDLKKLAGMTVSISAKANEKGHLFKGVHAEDIVAAIEAHSNVRLPKDTVVFKDPLKETGDHTVAITASEGKNITLVVSVVGER